MGPYWMRAHQRSVYPVHRKALSQERGVFNPLLCRKCGGNMKIVAFITDYQSSKSILKHIEEETIRPPPLIAKIPAANIPDTVTETSSAQAFGIPYLLWRPTYTACPELVSGIPSMSIKKSQKALSEKCAQKPCAELVSVRVFTTVAGGKTDKVVQNRKNITHPPAYAP